MSEQTNVETKKEKKFKWNEDSEKRLIAIYDPANSGATVEAAAKEFGVSTRAVISKLVSLEKYQTPQKAKSAKMEDEGPTKKDIQKALKAKMNIEGSDGATKAFLLAVAEVLGVEVPNPVKEQVAEAEAKAE